MNYRAILTAFGSSLKLPFHRQVAFAFFWGLVSIPVFAGLGKEILEAKSFLQGTAVKVFASALPATPAKTLLSEHSFSLNKRYSNKFVSDVFKDNILLNIAYLSGKVQKSSDIKWSEIRKPFTYEFVLQPGQVFAYHDAVLPEFAGKVVKTTNAHFDASEGFVSDGYLYGDGVCHLASLMNWSARDAKLEVVSLVNHDFAHIPEVPREYGVSIYSAGGASVASEKQNLYIRNNLDTAVSFIFAYDGDRLTVSVYR